VLIFCRAQSLLTHQYLINADVSLLGESILTIKKNTECLLVASKEIDLQVNVEKTKHVLK